MPVHACIQDVFFFSRMHRCTSYMPVARIGAKRTRTHARSSPRGERRTRYDSFFPFSFTHRLRRPYSLSIAAAPVGCVCVPVCSGHRGNPPFLKSHLRMCVRVPAGCACLVFPRGCPPPPPPALLRPLGGRRRRRRRHRCRPRRRRTPSPHAPRSPSLFLAPTLHLPLRP